MKKIFSRVLVSLLAVFMVFAMSGCSESKTDLMDFLLNGWDGVYTEKEIKEHSEVFSLSVKKQLTALCCQLKLFNMLI